MKRSVLTAIAALTVLWGMVSVADAAPCRDAKGKFIKCPPVVPVAATRCKDAKGKFAKCGALGAVPIKK